ncbi:hypothetical protein HPB52_009541 [Rhipicephalus sanguineus]|uniref:Uncharacterized protein n=1 Tax=Rhipicephalus sanguineus TaxID=34632 RepID=A0A9D4SU92_RHISA|nr:hypothetical protein HPB52_009541 [Rhipicephalus sanguineus]
MAGSKQPIRSRCSVSRHGSGRGRTRASHPAALVGGDDDLDTGCLPADVPVGGGRQAACGATDFPAARTSARSCGTHTNESGLFLCHTLAAHDFGRAA